MATFYVATSGSNGNPGTIGQPWADPRFACGAVGSGDTIRVGDGTYNYTVGWGIDRPLTLEAINSQQAILHFSGSALTWAHVAVDDHADDVHIYGMSFTQTGGGTGTVDCSMRWFSGDRGHIRDCSMVGAACPIKFQHSHNHIVELSLFRNSTGGDACIDYLRTYGSVVRYCDVQLAGGTYGIYCKSGCRDCAIYNNHVTKVGGANGGRAITLGGNSDSGVQQDNVREAENCISFNNLVTNTSGRVDEALCIIGGRNCWHINNVVVGALHCILVYPSNTPGDLRNWPGVTYVDDPHFVNNIWLDCDAWDAAYTVHSGGEIANNIMHGVPGAPTGSNGNLSSDPLFVSSSDFHTQALSPARGTGRTVASINKYAGGAFTLQTLDRDGNVRAAPWDIGIYQGDGVAPTGFPTVGATAAAPTSGTTETITATADEAVAWVLEWGTTTAYGSTVAAPTLSTTFSTLLTGLSPGSYHYRFVITDVDENETTTGDYGFVVSSPGGGAITAIEESPYASGDVTALHTNRIVHSFNGGANWDVLRAYADPALAATRLASGRFADLTIDRSYRFASFAGTSTNTMSRLLEAGSQEDIDWPTAAKPAQPSGLTMGLSNPTLYLTDTVGTGRTWRIDDFTGGGELVQKTWDAGYGLPQHVIRDGAIDELLYGAALGEIWKSYDGLETVVSLLALTGGRIGKMVGFGRLRRKPVPDGDLYASAMENPAGANQQQVGKTTNTIIRLSGTTWSAVSAHPIPTSEHSALLQGMGHCNFGTCTPETQGGGAGDYQFVRPLLRAPDGTFYTFCVPIMPDRLISVTPTYNNLYKSTNNCATWTQILTVAGIFSLDIAIDGALWVIAGDGESVQRSTDGGTTWTAILDARPRETDALAFPCPNSTRYLNRWQAISCSPNNAGRATVSCGKGLAHVVALVYQSAVKNFNEAGFTAAGWGIARTPVDDATIADRRVTAGYTTYRIPDSVHDSDIGGPYSVLGATLVPDSGAGFPNEVNAYRRFGGRLVFLGQNASPDNDLGGSTYYSTDNGNSWSILLGIGDTEGLAAGVCPASRDVGHDAAKDTLYAGLAMPNGDDTAIAFMRKVGTGDWQDLTGSMVAALGAVYSVHPLGMVVGVASA